MHVMQFDGMTIDGSCMLNAFYVNAYAMRMLIDVCMLLCRSVYKPVRVYLFWFNSGAGERTGLVVRASDSGSGDPGSILGRVGVLQSFLEQETFTPQKYW